MRNQNSCAVAAHTCVKHSCVARVRDPSFGARNLRYTELTRAMKPRRDSTTIDFTFALKDRSGTRRDHRPSSHRRVERAMRLNILHWRTHHARSDRSRMACLFCCASRACDTPTHDEKQPLVVKRVLEKKFSKRFFAESSQRRFEFLRRSVGGFFLRRVRDESGVDIELSRLHIHITLSDAPAAAWLSRDGRFLQTSGEPEQRRMLER